MKRQIYVPFSLMRHGEIPKNAISLSKETHLGIQLGNEQKVLCTKIQVIEIPEKQVLGYHKQVFSGFIQSIDYLDEFFVFDKTTQLQLISPCGQVSTPKPRIKERHMLSYRERLYDEGKYLFSIVTTVNEETRNLTEGMFEVI